MLLLDRFSEAVHHGHAAERRREVELDVTIRIRVSDLVSTRDGFDHA
jgi:hypothetical protein